MEGRGLVRGGRRGRGWLDENNRRENLLLGLLGY